MAEVTDSPAETRHAIVESRPAVSAWTWVCRTCVCAFGLLYRDEARAEEAARRHDSDHHPMPDPVSPVDSPALDLDAVKGRAERAMTSDIYTQQGAARLRYVLQHDIPALMAEVERFRADCAVRTGQLQAARRHADEYRADRDRLAARLQAVEALHVETSDDIGSFCRHCGLRVGGVWPCRTVRVLTAVPAAEETTDHA